MVWGVCVSVCFERYFHIVSSKQFSFPSGLFTYVCEGSPFIYCWPLLCMVTIPSGSLLVFPSNLLLYAFNLKMSPVGFRLRSNYWANNPIRHVAEAASYDSCCRTKCIGWAKRPNIRPMTSEFIQWKTWRQYCARTISAMTSCHLSCTTRPNVPSWKSIDGWGRERVCKSVCVSQTIVCGPMPVRGLIYAGLQILLGEVLVNKFLIANFWSGF